MRIALVHSYYRSDLPSGENVIVDQQAAALRARGHDVHLVARHSDEIGGGRSARARVAWDVATGRGFDPSAQLRAIRPDVVHVHNLFPNLATRWLPDWRGPLVATLHNFRTVCANAVLTREGRTCTLCPDGHRWAGVVHSCYRESAVATLPLSWRNRRGAAHDPVVARADRVVLLSDRARDILVRAGVPTGKVVVIPNGIRAPEPAGRSQAATPAPAVPAASAGDRRGWVAFGRLSPEKGYDFLLRNWPVGIPLDLIGAGPAESALRRIAPPQVRFLGALPYDALRARLGGYRGAVFAGVTPEGAYPLTVAEAWAAGTPVAARAGGAAADMVARWGGGSVYRGAADLAAALTDAARTPAEQTRAIYQSVFAQDTWIDRLLRLYADAAAAAPAERRLSR